MKLYKLTDQQGVTHGTTQWGPGVTQSLKPCDSPRLCTSDVIHAYQDPNLALLMNPVHANYSPARLWEAEGEPCVTEPDKLGCFSLKTVAEMSVPDWYVSAKRREVQVRFAVLAAEAVLPIFEKARPDDDRPRKAIKAARKGNAAYGAYATAYAANAAYDAANAAAYAAAYAAYGAYYAVYAANAANAAVYAANAAANAAYADSLDLAAIARQAVQEVTA